MAVIKNFFLQNNIKLHNAAFDALHEYDTPVMLLTGLAVVFL